MISIIGASSAALRWRKYHRQKKHIHGIWIYQLFIDKSGGTKVATSFCCEISTTISAVL
jgi:hypothetical protein